MSVRSRTGSRRTIDVSVIPVMDTSTGRVVGALEQFQLVAGRREADVGARTANVAARPDPMAFGSMIPDANHHLRTSERVGPHGPLAQPKVL